MIICGIDVGQKGAVGFINTANGNATVHNIPYIDGEVDACQLREYLMWLAPSVIWIEEVHSMPRQGVKSMFTFGRSFGATVAVARLTGIPVEFVIPQVWKPAVGIPPKSDKKYGLRLARELFPDVDLHWESKDGRADALLIAEYGRRLHEGTI